jgi:hypothetical protein
MKKTIKKMSSFVFVSVLCAFLSAPIAHAQIVPRAVTNIIGSAIQNVVDTTKENAQKNSTTRNDLIVNGQSDIQAKENDLADQLDSALSDLQNIQTRMEAKTAEIAASGTDTSSLGILLVVSENDIVTAQSSVSLFTSSVSATSTIPVGIVQARQLAHEAIDSIDTARADLQSALDALVGTIGSGV